jgi:16S rRNA (cytidine1402-2'-O)-methyltransferase
MLYIVGTPIGNLEDISYRQAKILTSSEIILTEDTRSTGMLLQRIEELFPFKRIPSQRLISYYKENEFEKLPQILEMIEEEEKEISLISQAGMPLISDPGYLLVNTLTKKNIPFTVIPGPTAVTTALVYSGFNPQEHMFIGFLPKKTNDVKKILLKMKEAKQGLPELVVIFYESPERISDSLDVIEEVLPAAELCICRELTKKFEECIRGKATDLKTKIYKGELTVVMK